MRQVVLSDQRCGCLFIDPLIHPSSVHPLWSPPVSPATIHPSSLISHLSPGSSHLLIYPLFVHLSIHSPIHPLVHLFIHPSIHLSIHPLIHPPLIHSFIHPYVHLLIHSFIHPLSIHPPIYPSIHLFTHSFIHILIHLFIHSSISFTDLISPHSSIYPLTCPFSLHRIFVFHPSVQPCPFVVVDECWLHDRLPGRWTGLFSASLELAGPWWHRTKSLHFFCAEELHWQRALLLASQRDKQTWRVQSPSPRALSQLLLWTLLLCLPRVPTPAWAFSVPVWAVADSWSPVFTPVPLQLPNRVPILKLLPGFIQISLAHCCHCHCCQNNFILEWTFIASINGQSSNHK